MDTYATMNTGTRICGHIWYNEYWDTNLRTSVHWIIMNSHLKSDSTKQLLGMTIPFLCLIPQKSSESKQISIIQLYNIFVYIVFISTSGMLRSIYIYIDIYIICVSTQVLQHLIYTQIYITLRQRISFRSVTPP